ncbi:hypothetical protein EJB05_46947, partial [Eragrostis curvula]
MARSSAANIPKLRAALHALVVLLLWAALAISVASGDVVTYSVPAFNATTASDFAVMTTSYFLTSTTLFDLDAFPEFNSSEGFLLFQQDVAVWRAGVGGNPDLEASFNTSFTVVAGAAPVAFVVLKDTYPPFLVQGGLRGAANYTTLAGTAERSNATGALAVVEVGPVMSYGPDTSAPGLNVTVTPRGVGGRAVWVEYNATAHRVSVYVAGAGEPRPVTPLLRVPLGFDGWHWTTETASVGFFAGKITDMIAGVRDWEMTVDNISGDGKKGMAWWVILLAVLGSVAATATIVSAVVLYVRSRRRPNMKPSGVAKVASQGGPQREKGMGCGTFVGQRWAEAHPSIQLATPLMEPKI